MTCGRSMRPAHQLTTSSGNKAKLIYLNKFRCQSVCLPMRMTETFKSTTLPDLRQGFVNLLHVTQCYTFFVNFPIYRQQKGKVMEKCVTCVTRNKLTSKFGKGKSQNWLPYFGNVNDCENFPPAVAFPKTNLFK